MRVKLFLPGVAAVFTTTVVSLSGLYAQLLYEALGFRLWLYPLLLVSALGSAYYATFYLHPRTPLTVLILELGIWLTPAYLLTGRVLVDFLWPAFLIFTNWLMARGFGSQFVRMERVADELGDQAASTVSWEYESLASKGYSSLPMEYFWRRFFGFGFVIAVLAMAAYRYNLAIRGALLFQMRLLGSVAVASGLTLQAGAYLFRLQVLWNCAKAKVHPRLSSAWFRNLGIFLLVMIIVVNFAPVNFSPITADRLAGFFLTMLEQEIKMPTTPREQAPQVTQQFIEEELAIPHEELGASALIYGLMLLLMLVGLAVVILLVLGIILFALLKTELERLRGIPKLAVRIYLGLRNALVNLWGAGGRLKASLAELPQKGQSLGLPDLAYKNRTVTKPLPRGVRAMFRRIVQAGNRKGLPLRCGQTASEYGENLKESLFGIHDVVGEFFSGYQHVRYSKRKLGSLQRKRLLIAGRQILEEIKDVQKGD